MTAHDNEPTDESAADDHGAHEFPPVPAVRHITPAPEDFENPPGFANYVWPIFWCGLAGVLIMILGCYGWHEVAGH